MVAIFSYGFEVAANNFDAANVELQTLSNYENLLEQAQSLSFRIMQYLCIKKR